MNSLLTARFTELKGSFLSSQKELTKKITKKKVHAFRVAIKRLRAFLLLMEYLSKEKFKRKKIDRRLGKIFRQAGKVRTLHVHQSLLGKFKVSGSGMNFLTANSADISVRFKHATKKFNSEEIFKDIKKGISKMPVKKDGKKAGHSILKFSHKLILRSIKFGQKKDFHRARMQLKRAHYILEILRKNSSVANEFITIIDPLEDKLGTWQDWNEMLNTLKNLSGKKSKEAQALKNKISTDLKKEKTVIEAQLERDFSRLKRIFFSVPQSKSKKVKYN